MTFLHFEPSASLAKILHTPPLPMTARKCIGAEMKQIATRLTNIREYIEAGHYTVHKDDAVTMCAIVNEAAHLLPALLTEKN